MDLYREFGEVLSKSDIVILLPIYPAGEKPIPGVSSELIYGVMKVMGKDGVYLVENFEEAAELLRKILEEGDVVLLQGAGNVYRVFDIV
jgi:UDP-N-acetylmuramate--alanine ligase